jgi:hypothetical protein
MKELRDIGDSKLGEFDVEIGPLYFKWNTFGFNNVNTKSFVLLLASKRPLSFVSGQPVNLEETLKEANRTEFHHLMPRAFLKTKRPSRSNEEGALANFAFLSRSDNRVLGGDPPSEYRKKMPSNIEEILERTMSSEILFTDDFDAFIEDRAERLARAAADLCEVDVRKSLFEGVKIVFSEISQTLSKITKPADSAK